MKRLMLFTAGLTLLLCAWAFAAEQAATLAPASTAPSSAVRAKITKMRAPGVILEITDTKLRIERKVKNDVETMEFILEKPVKFKVGDKVRVSYVDDNGKMIVTRIVKTTDIKVKKQVKPLKDNGTTGITAAPAKTSSATK